MPCRKANIIGTFVAVSNRPHAIQDILGLARSRKPSYVCFATAHMLVASMQDPNLWTVYNDADRVYADGRPISWALHLTGHSDAQCVSGPQLTPELLDAAEQAGIPVGFYGGRQETLNKMLRVLKQDYPLLKITYCYSPPFRRLSREEGQDVVRNMCESGARLMFVGLGSPKQELWMGENTSKLPCVLLGVGAVFEFLSGEKFMPPVWIQNLGLTWLVRLCQEPRRLMRRNIVYSPLFVRRFLRQILPMSRTLVHKSSEGQIGLDDQYPRETVSLRLRLRDTAYVQKHSKKQVATTVPGPKCYACPGQYSCRTSRLPGDGQHDSSGCNENPARQFSESEALAEKPGSQQQDEHDT